MVLLNRSASLLLGAYGFVMCLSATGGLLSCSNLADPACRVTQDKASQMLALSIAPIALAGALYVTTKDD